MEKKQGFRVVGYLPNWAEDTDRIQYDVVTHINYAFAIPTAEGGLRPLENGALAGKLIAEAHSRGVQVFIAVGGWSYEDIPLEATFAAATETAEKRASLVDAILELCSRWGFDGVDLDWEYPRVGTPSGEQYEALVLDLADRLHRQGKGLSSAVISGITAGGEPIRDARAHNSRVLAALDWLNVMAYDGGEGPEHSGYAFAVGCGDYWREQGGMPGEKINLGLPFYARPGWAAYKTLLAHDPEAWSRDHMAHDGVEAWYNGEDTIAAKTAYALDNLGGVMIWELSQDVPGQHSLQRAIARTVGGR